MENCGGEEMSALAEGVDRTVLRSFEDLTAIADAQYLEPTDEDFLFYVKREFGVEYTQKFVAWVNS
jgi:hypothetical protein